MKKLYARAVEALNSVSRPDFVAGADIVPSITGHSIPREETVHHLLSLMFEIEPDQLVMHVGGGSGYLTAVLAELAHRVIYVDRNPVLADKARERFFSYGMHNIDIVEAVAETGVSHDELCDLVLCTTFIADPQVFLQSLREGGNLVCLEGRAGPVPSVAMFRRTGTRLERVRTLGWVDFNRNAEQILIDLGLVTDAALEQARTEAAIKNERVLDVLRRKLNLEEADLYRSLAQQRGMVFTDADEVLSSLQPELFRRFSRTFLDLSRMIPVAENDGALTVVTDDPDAHTDQLERLTPKLRITCLLLTPTDFRRVWSALDLTAKGSRFVAEHGTAVQEKEQGVGTRDLLGEEHGGKSISPYLVSVYEAILLDAVSEKASDIHIEQYENRVRIRLRVDGDLRDLPQYQLSAREIRGVINVIKLRAELNIAEHRLPQGGRSRLQLGETTYDLRIQTQPSLHGENAIIRLLPQTGRAMTIAELGMSAAIGSRYQRLLDNPAGLVLVVGPTGSGKSTTLYAGLQTLADDGRRKVITVEDPIEYSIDNIQQTRVRSDIGFNFADAMRAFVRQDPDIIMVGEIRDKETALEAIRASQTGHVVLSTLHSNDAVDSDIRNAISSQPPVGRLRWRAPDSGLVTMRDSALDHVIEGVVPMSELPRILPQERMAPDDEAVIEVLVTMFHELRNGQTMDGRSTDRLAGAALSTAEAVSVAHAASLNAWYYGGGNMTVEQLMHHIIGSALKDHPDDRRRLKHYFETAIAPRKGEVWAQVWALRSLIH